MTIYGIRRKDNGEFLPKPYQFDSMTAASIALEELLELIECHLELEVEAVGSRKEKEGDE